jgi:hypothetical protein
MCGIEKLSTSKLVKHGREMVYKRRRKKNVKEYVWFFVHFLLTTCKTRN